MKPFDRQSAIGLLEQLSPSADTDDPRERKRMLILDAAAELFTDRGFRKTSVGQVAERAGVAKGTVYLYFKNKAELMVTAIVEEKKRYLGRFAAMMSPEIEARDRLKMWVRALLVLGSEMPLTSRLLSGDREILAVLYQVGADRGEDWHAMQIEFIGQMIDEAARPHSWTPGEIADRARVLFGLAFFSGLVTEERVRGALTVERYAEILAEMIVDGVGPFTKGGKS
jgi:AcrR family transcriptional regulator